MSTVYFHISGFLFNNRKNHMNDQMYYEIINNQNGAIKQQPFKVSHALQIKKSYHLAVKDSVNSTFTIKLYKKTLLHDKCVGILNVPICSLQPDVVTMNNLQVNCTSKKDKIACRLVIHLSTGEAAYKAPQVKPNLPQMDLYQFISKPKEKKPKYYTDNMDAPLLSTRAY